MNIVHLRASNFYGGPERQVHFHMRQARGSRYHLTAASFTEGGTTPPFLRIVADDGLPAKVIPVASAYERRAPAKLKALLRETGAAILCTHDYRSTVLGFLATRRSPVRWIGFSRGFTKDDLKVRLFNWIQIAVLRFGDCVVAVSEAHRRQLIRLLIPAGSIKVVRNSIDIETFRHCEPIDLRARFGFPAHATVCVSGGRFSLEKGLDYLVAAALEVVRKDGGMRFVLFGDGPLRKRIAGRIAGAGMSDVIVCPGFEQNMPAALKGADLLVNPSLSEGLPNIVLEGMAVGLPVLATSVGGVPEIVHDGVTGRLVAPRNSGALAQAILQMVSRKRETRDMASRAETFVKTELGFDKQFDSLAEIYDNVRSGARRQQRRRGGEA